VIPPRPSAARAVPQPGDDPTMDAMRDYLAGTALPPAPDLVARVQARIDREPDRTPPRRYLLALVRLRPRLAVGAFRQLLAVVRRRGSFPASVRLQALGLVLVTIVALTSIGIASAVGVQRLLDDGIDDPPPPTRPVPPERDDRSMTPSAFPSDERVPASPWPTPLDVSPAPTDRRERPSTTPRPTSADADPGGDVQATPRPTRRPTQRPKATDQPDPTDRPTHRPRRTERPEPTETPEADNGGDDGRDGEEETEPPDDIGMLAPLGI